MLYKIRPLPPLRPSPFPFSPGSNVQGIETTATFDRETDEFVIHTPNEGATKWWIGNAACHGVFASVFARLKLPGSEKARGEVVDMGVHTFIVPIRCEQGGGGGWAVGVKEGNLGKASGRWILMPSERDSRCQG